MTQFSTRSRLLNYAGIATEQINPKTRRIDTFPIKDILREIGKEDRMVAGAVQRQISAIGKAVRIIVEVFRRGGRIFFIGAGTSGRLGVMEAAECPPTFHAKPFQIQAIMAGGNRAVFRSQEGAEDNASEGKNIIRRKAKPGDAVIGIAASGVTPFVLAALQTAKKIGCKTILITCNTAPAISLPPGGGGQGGGVDVIIIPVVGPEVIAGSTRMKAGTATKMILNMLTTAAMIRLGKVYGNRMVDLEIKSNKLKERAVRIVREIAGVSRLQALRCLKNARGRAKVAIVMAKKKINFRQSQELLKKHHGFLRPILNEDNRPRRHCEAPRHSATQNGGGPWQSHKGNFLK
ncbi:MAG: N-acetylmuramic acid 6-phosphate etherase [Elusimicrobia bacterium]|nr:N-acetylmuramic acid 6-phosphate etherase [Elusimicrobiota bacterium]